MAIRFTEVEEHNEKLGLKYILTFSHGKINVVVGVGLEGT